MAIIWNEAVYNAAYQVREKDSGHPNFGNITIPAYGRRCGVNIEADENGIYGQSLAHWKQRLLNLNIGINLSFGSSMLVVGCGYGYLIETALLQGMNSEKVWGADTSPYIQANKGTEADAAIQPKILDIDITDPNADFKPYVGGNGKFNWVITELVVESLDPATELQPFLDACDNLLTGQGGVAHILSAEIPLEKIPNPEIHPQQTMYDLGLQVRPLADWVAERPAHYWIDVHGFVIGGGV